MSFRCFSRHPSLSSTFTLSCGLLFLLQSFLPCPISIQLRCNWHHHHQHIGILPQLAIFLIPQIKEILKIHFTETWLSAFEIVLFIMYKEWLVLPKDGSSVRALRAHYWVLMQCNQTRCHVICGSESHCKKWPALSRQDLLQILAAYSLYFKYIVWVCALLTNIFKRCDLSKTKMAEILKYNEA